MTEPPTRVVTVNGRKRRPWALPSREKILAAAVEEIAEAGFDKARVADIARRAGMTAGSVYTWFENKEDLFRAALESALEAQITSNLAALGTRDDLSSVHYLTEIAALAPRNFTDGDHTQTQRLLIESYYASWREEAAREALLPRLREHLALYRGIIQRAQENGQVRGDVDAYSIAVIFVAVPLGISLMNLAGLSRFEDRDWLPIVAGLAAALNPSEASRPT